MEPEFREDPPLCPACGKPQAEVLEARHYDPETGEIVQEWRCAEHPQAS